jgi:hypothetical protein
MAAERDLELLDDYLANRLDEKRKSDFEQKLNTDPDLKSELELQQQFIKGIKAARIAELKSMLSNVPVPAIQTGGTVAAGKIAVWTLFIGLIGTGIYFYVDQKDNKEIQSETKTEKQQETPKGQPLVVQPEQVKPHEDSPVVSAEKASSENKPLNSPKATKKKKKSEVAASKEPDIQVFDPTAESNDDAPANKNESTIPKVTVPSIIVEIDSQNKKYNFHYQFRDGKLLLYGPFEQNLYEILEFFSDDKQTMFLFYKDNYYLLNQHNSKLRPLTAIEDQALIKKLKEYRN